MTDDTPEDSPDNPGRPPKVVIVGGGFAGFQAARSLAKRMGDEVDIVLVSPTNYFLYLPLLPEVAAGILEPRRISVALAAALPACVRHAPGEVDELDLDGHTIGWLDPEGVHHETSWDRLVIAAGSVHKVLPVPGITEYAQGFRGVPEALYLRDHLIRQVELAAMCEDPEERAARLTVVVVGGGYTGTEATAQGFLFTKELAASRGLEEVPRWVLVSRGEVLSGLDAHLGRNAERVLRERGVDVRTGEQVDEATGDGVRLSSSGEHIPTRTLLWCVGVRPDPLIDDLGVEVDQGRIVVDTHLRVPGHPHVFACGDAAAVPDQARPGEYTAMTAQHAERQGKLAGRNVAASLGHGRAKAYKHRDLGFVVDLGGFDAAANPLGLKMTGVPAHVVARGYHLLAMPGNRVRTAVDWLMDALLPRQTAQLGLVRSPAVPLDSASPEVPQHGLGFPHGRSPGQGDQSSDAVFPPRPGGSAEASSPDASSEAASAETSSEAATASGGGGSPGSGAR